MPHLKLLGGAVLEDESGALTGPAVHRHSLALLALLASSAPRGMSRTKGVGYLWPEVPESTARNRLNTHIHRLRRELGAEAVVSAMDEIRLNERIVTSDIARFEEALEADEPESAVALYDGPFLDGFFLGGSMEFDHWLEAERARLQRAYRGAIETLARRALKRDDPNEAVRWWRERIRAEPFDSRATAELMGSLMAAGNHAEALDVGRNHAELLERELGTGPGDRIEELMRRIRSPSSTAGEVEAAPKELDPRALAVLPFDTAGEGEEARLFALGIHQDLMTRLSRTRDLRLISRTSVLGYRDRPTALREIGAELGVGTVVEGSVLHVSERVRVSVRLVSVTEDAQRWAETYDRELTAGDLFDIQSDLAERVARSLQVELDAGTGGRIRHRAPTDDLEAYRLHAQGRDRLDERTETGMRHAEALFREALERDPGYTLAWVGLADTLALLYEYGYADEAVLAKAETAAHRAIELDPGLAEARTSLGLLHEARHQGPDAIREYSRAVELQPGYADAHNWLSWTNQNLGRAREALAHSREAVSLNPLAPEVVGNLAVTTLMTGDAHTALREARRARSLQPDEATAAFYEALALERLGRLDEASELLEGLQVPWSGSGPRSTLALVHAGRGEPDRAREMLKEFETERDWAAAGLVLASLGELDGAFRRFARITRWPYWPTIALHHHFPHLLAGLRGDARFPALLGRVRSFWGLNPDGSFPGKH